VIRVLAAAAIVAVLGSVAGAEGRRYALLVGANQGDADDVELVYAEADAERLADTLRDLGGFATDDVVVLAAPSAAEVKAALVALEERIAAAAEPDAMLVVYYSGHGDAQGLHLGSTRLEMADLRALVEGTSAQARVLVVDACRSGALTRVKGGTKGPAFDIDLDVGAAARGMVVITSSAAGEDAQESDKLRGSFFTFYLRTGLAGSADANGDGDVTLAEVYTYTADATIAATSRTAVGPQHPTFDIRLGGREDLVLTRLARAGAKVGTLELPEAGWWLVATPDGKTVIAEVRTDRAGHVLALRAGTYRVIQRRDDDLREGKVTVAAGASTAVGDASLKRSAYARVVRRGGTEVSSVWSMFAAGGVRTEPEMGMLGTGITWRGDLGVRIDLPSASFEARAVIGRAKSDFEPRAVTWDLGASFAAVRVVDAGRLAFGFGAEIGASLLRTDEETASGHEVVTYPMFTIGPLAQTQLAIGRGYLRADAVVLGTLVKGVDGRTYRGSLELRAALGAGFYF
jgi:hypothetical protein